MQMPAMFRLGATSSFQLAYCIDQGTSGGNDGSCPCLLQRQAEVKAAFRSHDPADKPKALNMSFNAHYM